MKLSTFILASTLVLTGSITAMEQQEKTNTEMEQIQPIPNECKIKDGLLVDRPDRTTSVDVALRNFNTSATTIKAKMQRDNLKICCIQTTAWLFCCPCMCCGLLTGSK